MGFVTMLNTMVIMGFDECGGKFIFGIPSKVSLIKDLSLIKDKSHIDTSIRAYDIYCPTCTTTWNDI